MSGLAAGTAITGVDIDDRFRRINIDQNQIAPAEKDELSAIASLAARLAVSPQVLITRGAEAAPDSRERNSVPSILQCWVKPF